MTSFALKNLPIEERPRERLLSQGASALSTAELLAIVLGSGVRGKSVLLLAQELLAHFGSLSSLLDASIEELQEVKGIGRAKSVQLKAAFSLALKKETSSKKELIKNPSDVVKLAKRHFRGKKKELLLVILRDIKGYAYHEEVISVGSLTEVIVHPREVLHHVIRHKASSFLLLHNHPSGDPAPSKEDQRLTEMLLSSSRVMGVRFDDHLIIGQNSYTSFWLEGLLKRTSGY